MTIKVHGADLSHHNATPNLIAAKKNGLQWLYHKATEGATVKDTTYPERRRLAKAAGLPFGAYHFARPDRDGKDARIEAQFFIKYADPKAGDLVPVLDFEVEFGGAEEWCTLFMAEVIRLLRARGLVGKPIHYGPDDFGSDYKFRRWVPRYNNSGVPPVVPWDIWQFSDGKWGNPNSFIGLGHVDLNHSVIGVKQMLLTKATVPDDKDEAEFWFSFSAGRYDRSLKSLRDAVDFYLTRSILHGGTEAGAEAREKVLREAAREENFGLLTGDKNYRDDTYIMWDKDFFRKVHGKTVLVKSKPIFNWLGKLMPDNACTIALLIYKPTGHRLLVSMMHPPAGVEKKGSFAAKSRRGVAWVAEHYAWRRVRNQHYKLWEADAMLTAEDSNVNIKIKEMQRLFKKITPGMRLVQIDPKQKKGTFSGGRWIDIAFMRGKIKQVTKAVLMIDDDSSEHRPWKVKLRFTKKPRKRT